jgi:hypothetical protein
VKNHHDEYVEFGAMVNSASAAIAGKTVKRVLAFRSDLDFWIEILFEDGAKTKVSAAAYWNDELTTIEIETSCP